MCGAGQPGAKPCTGRSAGPNRPPGRAASHLGPANARNDPTATPNAEGSPAPRPTSTAPAEGGRGPPWRCLCARPRPNAGEAALTLLRAALAAIVAVRGARRRMASGASPSAASASRRTPASSRSKSSKLASNARSSCSQGGGPRSMGAAAAPTPSAAAATESCAPTGPSCMLARIAMSTTAIAAVACPTANAVLARSCSSWSRRKPQARAQRPAGLGACLGCLQAPVAAR